LAHQTDAPKSRRVRPVSALDSKHEVHERVGGVDRVKVGKGLGRPANAGLRRRPDSEKGAPVRGRKLPSRDEVWHRRTERVNKELTDDLRGRLTVEVGGYLIWVPGGGFIGQK